MRKKRVLMRVFGIFILYIDFMNISTEQKYFRNCTLFFCFVFFFKLTFPSKDREYINRIKFGTVD